MFLSRTGRTLATLAALSVWFIGPDTPSAVATATGPDFPQALLALASLLQLAISGWVLLIICLSRSRIVRVITPAAIRRALFVGAVGALALSPAQADRSPAHATVQHSLNGLRLPDRPMIAAAVDQSVIVKPGDTLWAIAARSLPLGASDAAIARACARWYAVNRDAIGDDPDLIHPLQHLTPPTKDRS